MKEIYNLYENKGKNFYPHIYQLRGYHGVGVYIDLPLFPGHH
jgi:hypothetical protein